MKELKIGEIYEGIVTKLANFGAFVQLPDCDGKEGLVHISEIADAFVSDINKFLKTGETIRIKLIDIKPDGKIYFSIKQARPAPDVSFEDKIANFLKRSEEKLLDLKKNLQDKIGGKKKGKK